MSKISINRAGIDYKLQELHEMLPSGKYRLTLICRYVGEEKLDADIILTDELNGVGEVQRLLNRMNELKKV